VGCAKVGNGQEQTMRISALCAAVRVSSSAVCSPSSILSLLDHLLERRWLKVKQAHTTALCDLGTMYKLGVGVRRNLLAAADFHLIAAEKGDQLECNKLAGYRSEREEMAVSGSQMEASNFFRRYLASDERLRGDLTALRAAHRKRSRKGRSK
jgi:TPR repeat protein